MSDLLTLAERVEATVCLDRGPLDDLSRAVFDALPDGAKPVNGSCPDYCGSLDAAMTLVPEGWFIDTIGEQKWPDQEGRPWWAVIKSREYGQPHQHAAFDAATPALALTAAALRARATHNPIEAGDAQ